MQFFSCGKPSHNGKNFVWICNRILFAFPRNKLQEKLKGKKIRILSLKLFEISPASNIVMEYSFDITKIIWRVWSIFGRSFHSTAGYFFKNCQKLGQILSKNDNWHTKLGSIFCTVCVQIIQNYLRYYLYSNTNLL